MIDLAAYLALPRPLRRLLPVLDRCRAKAKYAGLEQEFEDVWILGNDAMRSRIGPQYEPEEILRTLLKYHVPRSDPKEQSDG